LHSSLAIIEIFIISSWTDFISSLARQFDSPTRLLQRHQPNDGAALFPGFCRGCHGHGLVDRSTPATANFRRERIPKHSTFIIWGQHTARFLAERSWKAVMQFEEHGSTTSYNQQKATPHAAASIDNQCRLCKRGIHVELSISTRAFPPQQ
jgi:hypothetical protein